MIHLDEVLYLTEDLNVAESEESSSTEGKTLSKELVVEHEFADDETRHRLIELHTPIENEKNHHLLLATIALVLNPPMGLIACILIYLAKRKSKYLLNNYENISYERAATRYAFISYILSIISIGLTISLITAVLLYFFVRDLKMTTRHAWNTIRYEDMLTTNRIGTVDTQQQEQDETTREVDDSIEQEASYDDFVRIV